MKMNRNQSGLFIRVVPYFASLVRAGFKELLETKHLYQNFRIDRPDKNIVVSKMKELLIGATDNSSEFEETTDFIHSALCKIEWSIENPTDRKTGGYVTDSPDTYQSLRFTPPSIKMYCGICKRIEAYNFQYGIDLLEKQRGFLDQVNEQVFSLAYQCQSCKRYPEIFIIHRQNLKLSQSGRSPMEVFDIPNFIPKGKRNFFSDAIIAYNSGQILAGNFLLRTFIEQFVKSKSSNPITRDTDTLFDEYVEKLPIDFRNRFPSLKSIYSDLSVDLHNADGSEEVFIKAKKEVEKHFKAKEVYDE